MAYSQEGYGTRTDSVARAASRPQRPPRLRPSGINPDYVACMYGRLRVGSTIGHHPQRTRLPRTTPLQQRSARNPISSEFRPFLAMRMCV
eukprot:2884933-Prymnesium_polylepis.1